MDHARGVGFVPGGSFPPHIPVEEEEKERETEAELAVARLKLQLGHSLMRSAEGTMATTCKPEE